MSLTQALSIYGTLNLLIVIGYTGLVLTRFCLRWAQVDFSSQSELKLNYAALTSLCLVTLMSPLIPGKAIFQPTAKVWSAPSMRSFTLNSLATTNDGFLSFSASSAPMTLDAHRVVLIWMALAMIIFIIGGIRLVRDLRSLSQIRRNSYLVKMIGRVSIFTNSEIRVPFSYSLFRSANVVIPSSLLERKEDYRIAIAHELQHHRQRDTIWIYLVWFLRLLCAPNPVVHFWSRSLSEVQEFACDETLVDQKKVKSQVYARCLVEVAQSAIDQRQIPVCATGLTFLIERNLLTRRIEKMLQETKTPTKGRLTFVLGIMLVGLMTATAYASKGLVQDRRVTMEQAQEMAKTLSTDGFPIVINNLVLHELNRYVGTPEGRDMMKNSLARLENYRSSIEAKLGEYKVPMELLAIPIVESGYQNLPERNKTGWGAGLWMFIKSTAITYGMKVDDQSDDRMNTDVETDAAMRLLSADHLRFMDWQLAVMSYNAGETRIQDGINKLGTRDPWKLVRAGYEGDHAYLARVEAAILIMRNPSSVL